MTGRFSEDHQRPALPRRPPVWMKNLSVTFPDKRPDRPPELAPGKNWFYVGPDDVSWGTSGRRLTVSCSENDVVVFQEGLSFPTRELVSVVNNAFAVLVLRGTKDYFYLRNDFVLTAEEEDSLLEWGVGRPVFGNSLLAVGGTLLVAFAEEVWRPAVVGMLLVAAAGYRIEGAVTKIYRVMSKEWRDHLLVPSGIQGVERALQFVVLTLVALADLLDDKVLRLAALTCASMQVVLLEVAGQVVVTWTWKDFTKIVLIRLGNATFNAVVFSAALWLEYVFAGAFVWILFAVIVARYCCRDDNLRENSVILWYVRSSNYGAMVGVAIWAMVIDWNEAELKFSPLLFQLWRWPLFRSPVSFWTGLRAVGQWIAAIQFSGSALTLASGFFFTTISNDRIDAGKRTQERKEKRIFSHFHVSSIPSRNLLEPYAGQQTPDPRDTPSPSA